ncbi:plasmid partitioning protein RepB [Segnochrobactrum spirostomi]|uniref:Plasmid partitioning protein RepB n=1 Tax=Segnochrobactrum spirostomi TaxID=2608987 RepID=A0A6A7YAI6_9HYPH|nr:plasmid partitioning protein RepB [Segnochrobactrum spirostomi]MQT15018.1 plasmid partitioning protein RepB [Segnochrobactrum spirostomi]
MSKRADAIRNMFTTKPPEPSASEAASPAPARVAAGSVRAMKDSFVGIERENDELRGLIAAGASVVEIDPDLIDPAPIADRFADDSEESFSALKTSIANHGQEVPILVREHPDRRGRFQVAYGHRRLRAVKELGRKVRAVVRALTESELAIAQGLENSARQDLTFIERAVFARKLEEAGHNRATVQEALSIDRAEASKLISVARSIPTELVVSIGRAPKAGRGRWLALADALSDDAAWARVQVAMKARDYAALASDQRFTRVLSAATRSERAAPAEKEKTTLLTNAKGDAVVTLMRAGREVRISIDAAVSAGFENFLVEKLPALFAEHASHPTAKG